VVFDFFSDLEITDIWEEATRDFLGEALFLVVGVADWHVKDCFLKPLVFPFWVGKNHKRGPCLKAFWCQAWNIRAFSKFVLNKMMLGLNITEQA
jgi:hypothetical protein